MHEAKQLAFQLSQQLLELENMAIVRVPLPETSSPQTLLPEPSLLARKQGRYDTVIINGKSN